MSANLFCALGIGKGVPVDQLEKFLSTLEIAVGLPSDLGNDLGLEQDKVLQKLDTAYHGLVQRTVRVAFSSLVADGNATLKDEVRRYVEVQREDVLQRALGQQVSHIAIHGEVGLASKGWQRCKHHKTLDTLSPLLFRLIQVALRSTFPDKGFALRQYVLFHCVKASQVEVGESLASLLCSSYITTGGMNTAQAGVQLGDIQRMDAGAWKEICNLVHRRSYLRHVKPNLETFQNLLHFKQVREQVRVVVSDWSLRSMLTCPPEEDCADAERS